MPKQEKNHISPRSKVRIGVIGAGGISQVTHIPNILSDPRAELIAICDTDARRASLVAERFGIPTWFDQPEALFQHTRLDCVLIATPTITHTALSRMALEYGVDVLLEKPLARTLGEGLAIREAVEKSGKILMVGMNHRFRPDILHLQKVIEEGQLGEIIMVRGGWLKQLGTWGRPYWFADPRMSGGGVMMDLGLQMIDLTLYLLDYPEVVDVSANISHKALELEVEDSAALFIRFSNNISFLLEVSWANCDDHDKAYLWFSGTHGVATLNPLRIVFRQLDHTVKSKLPSFGDEVKLYKNSYRAELAHFLTCVQTRQPPGSDIYEALTVMKVVEQVYRSAGVVVG
ncbi:MAG: Gfo/Idh/MocA family protein [bacterium]